MTLRFAFDEDVLPADRRRIQEAVEDALESGAILPCPCAALEVQVYETRPPDFQASISCGCDVMRPLFSSTPETEEEPL